MSRIFMYLTLIAFSIGITGNVFALTRSIVDEFWEYNNTSKSMRSLL